MQGMKSYSEGLRTRIVRAVQEGGTSKSAAAHLFGVSLSSVKRYLRIAQGDVAGAQEGRRQANEGRPDRAETPRSGPQGASGRYRARKASGFLEHTTGKALSDSRVKRLLKRLGFGQKNGLWGRWSETNG